MPFITVSLQLILSHGFMFKLSYDWIYFDMPFTWPTVRSVSCAFAKMYVFSQAILPWVDLYMLCPYIITYIYICIHMQKHTNMIQYTHTHIYIYIYICLIVYVLYISIYIYMFIYWIVWIIWTIIHSNCVNSTLFSQASICVSHQGSGGGPAGIVDWCAQCGSWPKKRW